MRILVLNAGSSSLKASLFSAGREPLPIDSPRPLWEGKADWDLEKGICRISMRTRRGAIGEQEIPAADPVQCLAPLLESIWSGPERVIPDWSGIDVVGHRIVHGGSRFVAPTVITDEVRKGLAEMTELAPVHLDLEIRIIDEVGRLLPPGQPQVAMFDTAFHAGLPPAAHVYPGPYDWIGQGIRRYGFHGISYQYVTRRAGELLGRDPDGMSLIACHLGRGCSMAAVRAGRPVDTTMGFTPLEGLMMGSRSGSIDPGILIHLMRKGGYGVEELDRMLNRESGLLGISGRSGNMKDIIDAMSQGDARARLAFDIFVHRARACLGWMLASLGDAPDALVLTGGIGERSPQVRDAICGGFRFLGWSIDPARNVAVSEVPEDGGDGEVSEPGSRIRILVIRTRENWEIAKECFRIVSSGRPVGEGAGPLGS